MARHTMRSSVVFVSVGEETRVFRSLDDVPADWRRRFQNTEPGMRPKTIVIADPGGREELLPNSTPSGDSSGAGAGSRETRSRSGGDHKVSEPAGGGAQGSALPVGPRNFAAGGESFGKAAVTWTARQIAVEVGIAAALCAMILWAFLRP